MQMIHGSHMEGTDETRQPQVSRAAIGGYPGQGGAHIVRTYLEMSIIDPGRLCTLLVASVPSPQPVYGSRNVTHSNRAQARRILASEPYRRPVSRPCGGGQVWRHLSDPTTHLCEYRPKAATRSALRVGEHSCFCCPAASPTSASRGAYLLPISAPISFATVRALA